MKRISLMLAALLLVTAAGAQSLWPRRAVKELNGRTKELSAYAPREGVVLFVFWKTCCPNNITMLEELHAVWSEYNTETHQPPIRVVLVSLDDQRTASRVRPIVSTNGWEWPVIMDTNGDLARQYQVIMPPQWIAFDPAGRELFRSKVTTGALDSAIYFEQLVEEIRNKNL